MRIAISGSHRTGKTTLIEELSRDLPAYVVVDEPYYLLEEEGHEFSEMPSLEDFELQLERSIQSIDDSDGDQLFDRCPADMLAYLLSHRDSEAANVAVWLPRVESAMRRLDLIVFVPIESPDLFMASDSQDSQLRRRVDDELRDIVVGDRWDFGLEAIEVTGTLRERARQVLAHVKRRGQPATLDDR
jgi:predicted ATPase